MNLLSHPIYPYLCPMPNQELIHYIETEIIPRYEVFDKAHRTDHVRSVIERSLALATPYGADPDMVYTVAAYHDTGLSAEADRLIDPETILRRTVQYGLAHYPALDRTGHFLRLKEHLDRKYADGGYLRLWLPESDNAKRLAELRRIIRDAGCLQTLFDRIFDEETRRP